MTQGWLAGSIRSAILEEIALEAVIVHQTGISNLPCALLQEIQVVSA